MALDTATKQRLMQEYATSEGDTGSPEVQIALLSKRILDLTEHLKSHHHDHHTRRGLLLLVGRRRNLLPAVANVLVNVCRIGLVDDPPPAKANDSGAGAANVEPA